MTGVVREETGAKQSNRLRVVVDANLCTPPKDAYLGAIRMTDQQGRWKKAILKVSDLTSRGRNIVHLTFGGALPVKRSEEHTSELQSLMRISYAVFCLKQTKPKPAIQPPHMRVYQQCNRLLKQHYTHILTRASIKITL